MHRLTPLPSVLIALTVLLAAPTAQGQWRWVDADGRVTYSDQPPPAGVQGSRLNLRPEPPLPSPAAAVPASGPAAAGNPASATGSPGGAGSGPSLAERAAAFEARRREREAAERAAELAAREAETLARACTQLRESLARIESGMRLLEPGPDGERRVVDADARAARAEELRQALRRNCKEG